VLPEALGIRFGAFFLDLPNRRLFCAGNAVAPLKGWNS